MDMMEMRRRVMLARKNEKIAYEAWNLSFTASEQKYIDTGVYLFTGENIDKDFSVEITDLYGGQSSSAGTDTMICAKHDGSAVGFLIRCRNNKSNTYAGTIFVSLGINIDKITIKRINGVLSVESAYLYNEPWFKPNAVFGHPLVLGCALKDDGTPYRFATGTIGHIVVKWL